MKTPAHLLTTTRGTSIIFSLVLILSSLIAAAELAPIRPPLSALLSDADWSWGIVFGKLYPSYILATTEFSSSKEQRVIGDRKNVLYCLVKAPTDNCHFSITVEAPKFVRKSEYYGILPKKGEMFRVYPNLIYDFDALLKVKQPESVSITVSIIVGGQSATNTRTVTVSSVTDCLMYSQKEDQPVPLEYLCTAYLNENHPWIQSLMQEAQKAGDVDAFVGYQRGPEKVKQQMKAIWVVLHKYGIKYSSITTPSTPANAETVVQTVRLFEDSINYQQANCIDGSVLFASVFRRMGLRTYLILTPGHCFVGVSPTKAESNVVDDQVEQALKSITGIKSFYGKTWMNEDLLVQAPDDANNITIEGDWRADVLADAEGCASAPAPHIRSDPDLFCLETTMLGTSNFEMAFNKARDEYEEVRNKFGQDPRYRLICVDDARHLGINSFPGETTQPPPPPNPTPPPCAPATAK